MSIQKEQVINLVQCLSDKDVPLVYHLLTRLITDPKDKHIPFDDEPLTNQDIEAIKEAEEDYIQGQTIPFEELENKL